MIHRTRLFKKDDHQVDSSTPPDSLAASPGQDEASSPIEASEKSKEKTSRFGKWTAEKSKQKQIQRTYEEAYQAVLNASILESRGFPEQALESFLQIQQQLATLLSEVPVPPPSKNVQRILEDILELGSRCQSKISTLSGQSSTSSSTYKRTNLNPYGTNPYTIGNKPEPSDSGPLKNFSSISLNSEEGNKKWEPNPPKSSHTPPKVPDHAPGTVAAGTNNLQPAAPITKSRYQLPKLDLDTDFADFSGDHTSSSNTGPSNTSISPGKVPPIPAARNMLPVSESNSNAPSDEETPSHSRTSTPPLLTARKPVQARNEASATAAAALAWKPGNASKSTSALPNGAGSVGSFEVRSFRTPKALGVKGASTSDVRSHSRSSSHPVMQPPYQTQQPPPPPPAQKQPPTVPELLVSMAKKSAEHSRSKSPDKKNSRAYLVSNAYQPIKMAPIKSYKPAPRANSPQNAPPKPEAAKPKAKTKFVITHAKPQVSRSPASASNSPKTAPPSASKPRPSTQKVANGDADTSTPSESSSDIDESNMSDFDKKCRTVLKNLRGVDEAAAKQILTEIVIKGDEVHWDDIAGLEEAKKSLKETVVYPFLRPDLFSGLREPARGMLLFGPPGTGKTMLARAVATESKSTFFSISASSLTSKWLGESEKLVRALFYLAKEFAPSVIFADEIDSLLSTRAGSGENESLRRIKNEFLIQWSNLQSAAAGKDTSGDANRVLVLAATNLPWGIDEAARRRFVRRQYIPLPERETRALQLKNLFCNQKTDMSERDVNIILDLTTGFSGSDMTALAKDAAMGPLRSLGEALLTTPPDQIRPVMLEDFKLSLKYIRPSVSEEGLKEYEDWAKQFGSSGA